MSIGVSFGNISDVSNKEHKDLSDINQGAELDYECELKQPCSIDAPVFLVGTDTDLKLVNYAFCRSFCRYYFVTDVSATPSGYAISCATDTLTTAAKLYGLDNMEFEIERTDTFAGRSSYVIDDTVTTLAKMPVDKINFSKQITQANGTGTNYVLITA